MECYSCLAQRGERQIAPGPVIYDGEYWAVEHAYPTALVGWLVLVLKRHAEALHELSAGGMRRDGRAAGADGAGAPR